MNNGSCAGTLLTKEQQARVEKLSKEMLEEIDGVILSNIGPKWAQVAIVVALSMGTIVHKLDGVPAVFYVERIKMMADKGILETRGCLEHMRSSEVRRLQ
ncbi:MAG: hypothetical protein C0621_08920 [Desulfuromonas sp.]|nr:MAG: hypothetical protein C0621_08920 [Desulfuromonas sp.]